MATKPRPLTALIATANGRSNMRKSEKVIASGSNSLSDLPDHGGPQGQKDKDYQRKD